MRYKKRERGAAAIEFAILFPIFFIIFYAIVTYGLIFAAQQSMTLAAAEGARAAVRYQKGDTQIARQNSRVAAACDMANQSLSWLRKAGGQATAPAAGVCGTGTTSVQATPVACSGVTGVSCVRVLVTYNYSAAPLVPKLLGPVFSLPTPNLLQGQAVAQISLVD